MKVVVIVVGRGVDDSVSHGVDSGGAVVVSVHGVVVEVVSVSHGVEVGGGPLDARVPLRVLDVGVEDEVAVIVPFPVVPATDPVAVPVPVPRSDPVPVPVPVPVEVEVKVTEGVDVGGGMNVVLFCVLL